MRTDPFRFGTPMRKQTQRSLIRRAIRRKLPDDVLQAVFAGTATKAMVYGRHPTKKRAA
jgi:hypothetical protein